MTEISVLLSTYDAAYKLEKTIRSVLQQTFKDFELIIIDDGSNDNTYEVVSSFADERLRYFKKEHSGLGDSLNIGIEYSKGELIARIDAGDICHPRRFEKQIDYLNKHDEIDVLGTGYGVFHGNKLYYYYFNPSKDAEIKKLLVYRNTIFHPSIIFKKSIVLCNNGYKNIPYEDYELWLRISPKVVFANLFEILCYYWFDKNSITRSNIDKNKKIVFHFLTATNNYYRNYILSSCAPEKLKAIALREYFWGNRKRTRKYLLGLFYYFPWEIKNLFFFFTTFIPNKWMTQITRYHIPNRLQYLFFYLSKETKIIRNEFRDTLLILSEE
ncbi:MAG: glycosyltransferase [Melioribacteraceae bacterium]